MTRLITLIAVALLGVASVAVADEPTALPRTDAWTLETESPNVAAAAAAILTTAQASPSADDVVAGMQKYYDTVTVFSAQFEQVSVGKRTRKKTTSSGEVWFMKPGRMRWDFLEPDERYMISDGSTFWIWEPQHKQYCEQDLQSSTLPSALSFLSGTGDLRREFDATLVDWDGASEHRVQLTPKKANSNYQKIDFVVDATTYQVKKAVFEDSLQNISTLSFLNPLVNEENQDVDTSQFAFEPPPDAFELCKQLQSP